MDLLISSVSQGLLWGILSLGLFVSFRVLNMADLGTEGVFPLGAIVCVKAIHSGVPPLLALGLAFLSGALGGFITAFLITKCRINHLLAGILTMTGLYSINLRILGRPNLSLLNMPNIRDFLSFITLRNVDMLIIGSILVIIAIIFLYFFFKSELGQAIVATGDNEKMAISLAIDTDRMKIYGLMLSNAFVALSGGIMAQNNGFADVSMGIGTVVIGLASIILGEMLFKKASFLQRLVYTIFGAIVYRLILMGVLQLGLNTNDFKLISAGLIALLLTFSHRKQV